MLQIKLSENGDSDVYEAITLTEADCDLSKQQPMSLAEVILRKSSNTDFEMDSQVCQCAPVSASYSLCASI